MNEIIRWLTDLIREFKFWALVSPWERGVRVRAGKHAESLGPGIHWRIPVVDSVVIVNTRLRISTVPDQTLCTADGRAISTAGNVGFRIVDPLAALRSLKQPEISAAALVQATVAQYIYDRNAEELDIREMEESATEELKKLVDGIEIEFVRITDFVLVNRTFRLLGERWQPSTTYDKHDEIVGG